MSENNNRDVRLDALRGLLLVVMTMDHFPSLFFNLTYESLGYITAAEGFVFLSGLVAGRVYNRYYQTGKENTVWKRAFTRAGIIYSFHISTFVLLLILAAVFSLKTWCLETWAPRFYEHPILALSMGLTLSYQPHFLDILPMYCLFILIVPLIARHSKWSQYIVILLISGLIWLIAQFGVRDHLENFLSKLLPVDFGTFDIFSWQFIFILGVVTGVQGKVAWKSHDKLKKRLLLACAVIAGILFLIRHQLITGRSFSYAVETFTQVGTLGPVRLLNFIVIAFIVGAFAFPVDNILVRGLAFLGRHSLQVFTFHIFLLYFFYGVFLDSSVKEIWVLLFVSSLFLPAWFFERYKSASKLALTRPERTSV